MQLAWRVCTVVVLLSFVISVKAHGLADSPVSVAPVHRDAIIGDGTRPDSVGAGIMVTRFGHESQVDAVSPVAPNADGMQISYRHPEFTEWFVRQGNGVEHGVTVRTPPAGVGTLSLIVAVGGAIPIVDADGLGATLVAPTGDRWRYDGLHVSDVRGQDLPARMFPSDDGVRIVVDDVGAVYPVTIDPYVRRVTITGPGRTGEYFGSGVVLSGDGTTLVIGANNANGGSGAAYVYKKSGDRFPTAPSTTLMIPGPTVRHFGGSLALSRDGKTLIVGANGSGTVYSFVDGGSGFPTVPTETLIDPVSGTNDFGSAVALSADASTLAIRAATAGGSHGVVYVYSKQMGLFPTTPTTTLLDYGTGPDELGNALALSADGSTLVAGAIGTDGSFGAASVYVASGGTFPTMPTANLPGPRTMYAYFGYAVAISDDGTTVAIGALGANNGIGSVYIYAKGGGIFHTAPSTTILNPFADQSAFGSAIALSGDGTTLVVGAYTANVVFMYVKSGGVFANPPLSTVTSTNGTFGISVTVAENGSTVVAGAYLAGTAEILENLPPPRGSPAVHPIAAASSTTPTGSAGTHPAGPMSGAAPAPYPSHH